MNCPVLKVYAGGIQMNRTKLKEEIKKMRFEEAYGGWLNKELTQEQAACLLGVVKPPNFWTQFLTNKSIE